MLNKLKLLSTISLLLCFSRLSSQDFEKFKAGFIDLKLPLTISGNWKWGETRDLIDTTFIKKFHLLDKMGFKSYNKPKLDFYQSSYIGKFSSGKNLVLLYKTLTTDAGDGNPCVVAATFSHQGKFIDGCVVMRFEREVEITFEEKKLLVISDTNSIDYTERDIFKGYLNGKLVPKKITEEKTSITIGEDGKFVRRKGNKKVTFEDKNPNIKDA